QLDHASFLAQKLDALIQTFQIPAKTDVIRITPSRFENDRLEERAIPYYYVVNETNPIQQAWSYRLHQQGMDARNYSYNAAVYGAQGGAASPFTAQMGCFSFFRIEGYLGQDVSTATTAIENEIKANGLPFTVRAVFCGTDPAKAVVKPGIRYTDLHRLHYLLRQDASDHLDDVARFSVAFKQQVDDAISNKVVTDPDSATTDAPSTGDATYVREVAQSKQGAVATSATSGRDKLARSFSTFRADPSWKADLGGAMSAASEFKFNLGKVVKTEFPTPFDSLISSRPVLWVDWLDQIIKQKDDQAKERLLWGKFVTEHPGIEHFAGVTRGGTFVLVYDTDNRVIADFMLPYICCEPVEEEPVEPPLTKPEWKPDWVVNTGLRINQSIDKVFVGKLTTFKEAVIDPSINLLQQISILRTPVGNDSAGGLTLVKPAGEIENPQLNFQMTQHNAQKQEIEFLQKQTVAPDISDEERGALELQLSEKEEKFASTTADLANTLVSAKAGEVTASDNEIVSGALATAAGILTTSKARTATKDGINSAAAKALDTKTKGTLNLIAGRVG
ncbi:MAG: hypothetical protein ABLT11_05690, partial [Candidatus Acidiferrum sp.]